jgi:GntR family transcriptional repressor for pyruvate dehydrogenase complex
MPLERRAKSRQAEAPDTGAPIRKPASFELARRTLKTSESVALEIVRNIVSQNLQPGDRLPLESEMLVEYRVSRSSLREALRLLEVQGLITIRPGPGTGTVVGHVVPGNLARTLTLYLHMQGTNYDDILSAWVLTEPLLARLAAQNPDRDRVRAAMAPFVSNATGHEHGHWEIVEGLDFHDRVSALTNQPVLSLVLRAIAFIVTERVLTLGQRAELEEQIVHDHTLLADAIVAGDSDLSARLMTEHIEHIVRDFRAYWPQRMDEKIKSW